MNSRDLRIRCRFLAARRAARRPRRRRTAPRAAAPGRTRPATWRRAAGGGRRCTTLHSSARRGKFASCASAGLAPGRGSLFIYTHVLTPNTEGGGPHFAPYHCTNFRNALRQSYSKYFFLINRLKKRGGFSIRPYMYIFILILFSLIVEDGRRWYIMVCVRFRKPVVDCP